MRPGKWSSVAALLAALMWNMPQLALAHGGGGGHGGGGFGGGGFGGGHGGFGGGHMGGFGGGHMGGFGGGHMGGFGGHYGGFSGGHYGGLGGGHYGGYSGLGGHSGLGGYSLGGGHSGHSGLGSSIGGLHSGGIGHSGTLGGVSGLGSHHAGSALGTVHHNPNSFTTQHVAGQHLSNSALGNHVTSGYRGVGNTFAGTHAQGLLSHQANNVGGHSNFLQHHHVGGTGTTAGHGVAGLTGSSGMTGMHHGGMHHGGMGQGGMYGHHHGMYGNHGFNRGFYPFFGFPFFGFPFFGYGFGYPFYGLYGLYGLGYGGYYGYGGYGYGYGYNPYAYYYGPYGYGYNYPSAYAYPGVQNQPSQPAQPAVKASDSQVFAQKGENDFKAGDYKAAVYAWRHALVDDPQNGVLMMMLAQGLFASGNFNEAAGAVQQAMMLLPEDQWGVVVSNYRELYGKVGDYTTQLRALEKAVKDAPDEAGTRFLLGYHYGFLGYPQQAVKQLDKTLQLQPDDQLAKKLRDQFQAKLPNQGDNNAAPANGNKGQVNGQADDKTAGEANAADAKGA